MKNKTGQTLIVATSILAAALATSCINDFRLAKASDECIHNGYHYSANDPTETENGNVEFWTCCECHNYFLTKPSVGKFTDSIRKYGYDLPEDVIIPKTGKITVNSLTLTFNGVVYNSNDWTDKTFYKGTKAPEWRVTTNPSDAARYVDIWITKDEVDIGGWPTEVGDYVFCVGILPTNKKLSYGGDFTAPRYVKFSIVEYAGEKIAPTITFSLESNGLHVLDSDPLPTATVSEGANYTVSFSCDALSVEGLPKPTTTGVTWSIVVEVTENEIYTAKKEWRWFYYDHDSSASDTPSSEETTLTMANFDAPTRKWGSDGNNGITANNVSESDGIIDIKIEAAMRRGGALESKSFYGPGSFSMDAKFPKTTGICYSIWTFYYANNGDINHEIDIEVYDNNKVVYSSYVSETIGEHTYSDIDSKINDGNYHNYRIDWHHGSEGDYTEYYIDNNLMCKITKNIPTHDMKLWIGAWCPTWAGETMTGTYHMLVKNIKYKKF